MEIGRKQTEPIFVRAPRELKRSAEVRAQQLGMSISGYVRTLITNDLIEMELICGEDTPA